MELQCPHCRQRYDVDEAYLGQQIQCEWCHNWFVLVRDYDSSKNELQLESPPAMPDEQEIKEDHSSGRTCPLCGGEISADVKKCRHCGGWLDKRDDPSYRSTYFLLALFLGSLGMHNFFAGEKMAGFAHIIVFAFFLLLLVAGEGMTMAADVVGVLNAVWALCDGISGRAARSITILMILIGIIAIFGLGAILAAFDFDDLLL